ncbi:MAG: S-layer protein [Candidatus Aenigmarchaeota archaeon]|nr:S-layer protein [Candidatus Aenigmarchaeota archaeon]
MEIKRLIAGGLATLAAGATLALGAGAVTLGDFVTVSGNQMTSPYIVIGGNAAAEDTLAAADVAVALAGQATETVAIPGAQATASVTNGALIQTKSDTLYLGEALSSVGGTFKFTSKELPTLLATETFTQKDGNTVDVQQRIYVYGQSVQYGEGDTDWEEPGLYLKFADGENVFKYQARFTPDLDTEQVENKEITLLGKKFVFGEAEDNNALKLTMYESSQTTDITAGESTTINVDGTDYTVTVVGIDTNGDHATIDVNGESETYEPGDDIKQGDFEAHVKDIRAFKFPVESGSVQLFIGSTSTVLENGSKVTLGGDDVDDAWVLMSTNSTDYEMSSLEVRYATDDDILLKPGESWTEPVFGGAFKVAFGGMPTALDSDSKDLVKFQADSEDLKVTFTNPDGNEYSAVLASVGTGTQVLATADAADGADVVHFLNNETLDDGDYVVISDGDKPEYSYILEYVDFNSDDQVVLEDISTGTKYYIDANDVGDTINVGNLDVEVTGFSGSPTETVALNNTQLGTGTIAKLVTYGGAAITPYLNTTSGAFLAVGSNKYAFNVTEEADGTFDSDQDFTVTDDDFTVTVTAGGENDITEVTVAGVALKSYDDEDIKSGLTKAGTYVVRDYTNSEDDVVKLYIPDEPVPVSVAFGADPTFGSTSEVAAGTVEQAVQIKNSISKMESEVSTDSLNRDLVLLGGPCANGLVAELLEMSKTNPDCATEFTAEYPTEGVIKVVDDAWSSGHKALIVAGVNRQATRDLAVKVMQGTLDYSA